MPDYASQIKIPDYSSLAQGVQGLIGLQGNLLQQKALEQQIGANVAASEAMKQSVDPKTGQIDQAKFATLMSQGAGAYNLPTYLKNATDLQNAQLETQAKQLDLHLKQLGYFDGQLGGLLQMGDKVTSGDVVKVLSGGVQAGMMTPQQAVQYASDIPQDPAALQGWIRQHWTALQSAKDQLGLLPQGSVTNVGGSTVFTNRDPVTGQVTQAGAIQNTMTPGEATSPVQLTTPTGTPYATTRAQFAAEAAGAPQMAGQASAYTGRISGAPGPATDVPAGGMQTGLSPAEQARQAAGATAQANLSATAAQDLANAAADSPMRINLLEQARDALSNVQTGPGTDWRNHAMSFINSLPGGMAAKLGVTDPEKIASYDEFKKILTNYASSVSGAVGGGTDARLNAAITGNANPGISKMANEDILTKTIAAEKMRQAQAYAFQNAGLPPDQFTRWQTQWNHEINPDAFAYVTMTPDQQRRFVDRKTKDGTLGKFKRDLFKARPYLGVE